MESNPSKKAIDGNPLRLDGPVALIFKFGILALFVSALVGILFVTAGSEADDEPIEWPTIARIEFPTLDQATLAAARDATREERLVLEPLPLAHLLETALNLSTVVATAAGMSKHEEDPEILRNRPDQNRGRILWMEGKVERIDGPTEGHPINGYDIYSAHISTKTGQRFIFYYSLWSPKIRPGDWVRAEGYFLKLRDLNFPEEVSRAPILVGKRLRADFRDWGPVTEFDPNVFRTFLDGIDDKPFEPTPDSDRAIFEDQRDPLWHLAAYAKSQEDKTLEEWRVHPVLNTEMWMTARRKELPRATPIRVLGRFVTSRRFEAPPNPAGIEVWTEAWVQVPEVGGKLIPMWIAGDIGENWEQNDEVEARGYYYKLYTYEPRFRKATGKNVTTVIAPVFVSTRLDRYERVEHTSTAVLAWVFLGITGFIILLFVFVALRDRRRSKKFDEHRVARRRKLRASKLEGAPLIEG